MQEYLVPSVDGHRVRALFSGKHPRRQTITFVLPFGSRFDMARPFLASAAERFNVVTWEARVIIDDPALHADIREITPEMHVSDMISVLTRFEIARTDVIGYCSGAGIALLTARSHPDRIAKLALVSGEYVLPARVCPQTRFQADLEELMAVAAMSTAHANAIFSKLAPRGTSSGDDPVLGGLALPFSRPAYLYRYALNYRSYRKTNFLEVAEAVGHRALVIVGRKDSQVTVESSELIHRRLKNSWLQIEPTADHYDICRARTPINQEVLGFLSSEQDGHGITRHS